MNFLDALDTKVEDVERPPLLPIGTYEWQVMMAPTFDTIANGDYDVCDFTLQCVAATADVNPEELAQFLLSKQTQRRRFMFDQNDAVRLEQAMSHLRVFLEQHLQIDAPPGTTMKELLSLAVGYRCLGHIRWRPNKDDPQIQYAEIDKTMPLAA